jgi:hypothetical protein
MYCREALAQLLKDGVPERSRLPTVTECPAPALIPAVEALRAAARPRVILKYAACADDGELLDAIYQNGAAVVVIEVTPSFMANYAALTGYGGLVLKAPAASEISLGYHAVCAIGYDERGILIQNSFGPEWGEDGLAILPHGYPMIKERWVAVDKVDDCKIIEMCPGKKDYPINGRPGGWTPRRLSSAGGPWFPSG